MLPPGHVQGETTFDGQCGRCEAPGLKLRISAPVPTFKVSEWIDGPVVLLEDEGEIVLQVFCPNCGMDIDMGPREFVLIDDA